MRALGLRTARAASRSPSSSSSSSSAALLARARALSTRSSASSSHSPSRAAALGAAAAVAAAGTAAGLAWSASAARASSDELPAALSVTQTPSHSHSHGPTPAELAFRESWERTVKQIQADVCAAVERVDGSGKFQLDEWKRKEGGGGWTRVMTDGAVFEKAGVGVSTVHGELPPAAQAQMRSRGVLSGDPSKPAPFFACGVSLVIHPRNPMAPTVHANYRYFEVRDPATGKATWWFGGGSDLTPSYLFEEDAVEFHRAYKRACDAHDPSFYAKFKAWCDEYFFLPHRGEARGIGGIFYDDLDAIGDLGKDAPEEQRKRALQRFAETCAKALVEAYVPIMERRKNMPFNDEQKRWQQLRRGRYVEFNIGIDRGTRFGMQTPGSRTESILMSLPLTARWEYNHHPAPGSREDEMLQVLRKPRDWLKA